MKGFIGKHTREPDSAGEHTNNDDNESEGTQVYTKSLLFTKGHT